MRKEIEKLATLEKKKKRKREVEIYHNVVRVSKEQNGIKCARKKEEKGEAKKKKGKRKSSIKT